MLTISYAYYRKFGSIFLVCFGYRILQVYFLHLSVAVLTTSVRLSLIYKMNIISISFQYVVHVLLSACLILV